MKNLKESISERIRLLNRGVIEGSGKVYKFPFIDCKNNYHLTFIELRKRKGLWVHYK